MPIVITRMGYELDEPSEVHECGPSAPLYVDDALSHARSDFINGAPPEVVLARYKEPLRQLIAARTWRKPDAESFLLLITELCKARGLALVQTEGGIC
jgi:hypothetical protein